MLNAKLRSGEDNAKEYFTNGKMVLDCVELQDTWSNGKSKDYPIYTQRSIDAMFFLRGYKIRIIANQMDSWYEGSSYTSQDSGACYIYVNDVGMTSGYSYYYYSKRIICETDPNSNVKITVGNFVFSPTSTQIGIREGYWGINGGSGVANVPEKTSYS